MKPYTEKQLVQPTGFSKLLNRSPAQNYIVELNNILATHSLDEITADQIVDISKKHNLEKPYNKFKQEIQELFSSFIDANLGDQNSQYNDFLSAKKMQRILGVPDQDFEKIYFTKANAIFETFVIDLLTKTNRYQDEEDDQFKHLQNKLNVTKKIYEDVINKTREAIVQRKFASISSNARISPEEMALFNSLCKDLGVNVEFDKETLKMIKKYETLWQIEEGDIPTVDVDIFLQKNEKCFFRAPVELYETRTVKTGVGYSGPTFRVKLVKGLYYRAGSLKTNRASKDVMTLIDKGEIYITNKRILFAGEKSNKIIHYNKIVDLTPYTDGIEIMRDAGKPQTYVLGEGDGELLTALIARNIHDQQK